MIEIKILVVSDTHGVYYTLKRIIRNNLDVNTIVHCGDCHDELDRIQIEYPEKRFLAVRGNWDSSSMLKAVEFFSEQGVKIMITHGHKYHVKSSYDELISAAKEEGANVVLFGHTHVSFCKEEDGIKLLNPGSASAGSFGVVEINNGIITIRLEQL